VNLHVILAANFYDKRLRLRLICFLFLLARASGVIRLEMLLVCNTGQAVLIFDMLLPGQLKGRELKLGKS